MAVININEASTPEELKNQITPVKNTTGFHQITIDEYLLTKQEIEIRLRNIADNYVAIGFCLRQIMDSEAYRQEGYTSINDFAKKEYNLSESAVSRFIAINIRFSAGGYSDKLLPEYKNYGSSKLSEMLTLSDDDCRLIAESTTVATIRELKKFNKEAEKHANQDTGHTEEAADDEKAETVEAEVLSKKPEAYSDLEKVIIEFFRNERELLNEIYQMSDYESIADRINPSGSRTFRKTIYMLFMYGYGEGLILKKMGEENTGYTWQQFIEATVGIYKATYTDHDTVWENFYEPEQEAEQTETGIKEAASIKASDKEKHTPEPAADMQDIKEKDNKEEKTEGTTGSRTDEHRDNVENAKPAVAKTISNETTGSSETLATSQENSILSLRRWYMSNKQMSLDMGVKQEIADRLCISTTPETLEKITEFIEELTVEYTAYVYKNMGEKEMKLIDTDTEKYKLLDFIAEHDTSIQYAIEHKDRTMLEAEFLDYFEAQKVAYDVDNVVEKMKELERETFDKYKCMPSQYMEGYLKGIKKAIKIVKAGG